MTTTPALLPADHRNRVLALLADLGVEVESDYVADNGAVRVKVAQRTSDEWMALSFHVSRALYLRTWNYQFSHADLFIEGAAEMVFRPPEARR